MAGAAALPAPAAVRCDRDRPRLFALAYRMLGVVMDAEDLLQDCYLEFARIWPQKLHNPPGFLTRLVARRAIDQLRRRKREQKLYIGPWLPEPLPFSRGDEEDHGSADAGRLDYGMMLLLENLNPVERAVFLLREAFDYEYEELARLIGKKPANTRQIHHRARKRIQTARRESSASASQNQILCQFIEACRSGNLQRLVDTLSVEARLYTDSAGKMPAALNPIYGADRIARFLLGVIAKRARPHQVRLGRVDGLPAIVFYDESQRASDAALFQFVDGRIERIYAQRNPDKLGGIGWQKRADPGQ